MSDATFEAEPPKKKSKWGCILGGCLGVVVIGAIGMGVAGFIGWRMLAGQVEKYTSDTPRELPVVEYSDEQMQELQAKLDRIKNASQNGEVAEPLVLTADDINALLAKEEDFRGRVAVRIENGQFVADVSIPTDKIPGGKGRFFNGSATANASLRNGRLDVNIDQASVNGEPVPEQYMAGIRAENIAKDLNKEEKVTEVLELFESGEIDGDKVILTPAGSTGMLESSNEPELITP